MKHLLPFLCLCLATIACEDRANKDISKADSLFREGEYEAALVYIEKAEKVKNNTFVTSIKSSILGKLGQCAEAVELGRKAIKSNSNRNFSQGYLLDAFGSVWIECGRNDSAVKYYLEALAFADNANDSSASYSNIAAAYGRIKNLQDAYKSARNAIRLDPNRVSSYINLGNICDELGKYEEGIQYLKTALSLDSTAKSAYTNLGFIYQKIGNYESSTTFLDKAIEVAPGKAAYPYNNRAYNKLQLGDLEGAMQDVNTSLELDNKNAYAYRNRALIWLAMDEKEKVCEDIDLALRLDFTARYGDEVEKLKAEYCE